MLRGRVQQGSQNMCQVILVPRANLNMSCGFLFLVLKCSSGYHHIIIVNNTRKRIVDDGFERHQDGGTDLGVKFRKYAIKWKTASFDVCFTYCLLMESAYSSNNNDNVLWDAVKLKLSIAVVASVTSQGANLWNSLGPWYFLHVVHLPFACLSVCACYAPFLSTPPSIYLK